MQLLDEKSSLAFENPVLRKNRKGDVRFVCGDYDCSLESDTSVITQLGSDPGATLDTCRVQLTGVKSHDLTLATAAAGSEICVKNSAGDIALLVIRIKSTAVRDSGVSFVMADVTIWRAA